MKDKQIQELLLTHYLFAIEMVRGQSFGQAREIIDLMEVDIGVCLCAFEVFGAVMVYKGWVRQYKKKGSSFWYKSPCNANTTNEITACLQARVNILQKILTEPG